MIHDIIGSGILVAVGAGGMWAIMRVRLAIAHDSLLNSEENAFLWEASEQACNEAYSRLSDAHNSTKERIERALECETAGANATVKRMARILKGDQ